VTALELAAPFLLISVIILFTELFFTFLVHNYLVVCFETVYLLGLMRDSSFGLLRIQVKVSPFRSFLLRVELLPSVGIVLK